MAYAHILNLYKLPTFMDIAGDKVYALEKIHGSSAHVSIVFDRTPRPNAANGVWTIHRHAGGQSDVSFEKCVPTHQFLAPLTKLLVDTKTEKLTIYGEVYGGKCQKMSGTYGVDMRFVGFDVEIDGKWLTVPKAETLCKDLGIEFVHYELVDNTLEALDKQRDADSVQAIRNGMGPGKLREGIVIKPLVEMVNEFNERLVVKHKRAEFREMATPREVDPAKAQVLSDAQAVSDEWVVDQRLEHVLQKLEVKGMEDTPRVIKAMLEDVKREGEGEIVWSTEVERAIGKRTAALFKKRMTTI